MMDEGIRLREQMYIDKPFCAYCCVPFGHHKIATIDHIIPRAMGGNNARENLQLLCKNCHLAKSRIEQQVLWENFVRNGASFDTRPELFVPWMIVSRRQNCWGVWAPSKTKTLVNCGQDKALAERIVADHNAAIGLAKPGDNETRA